MTTPARRQYLEIKAKHTDAILLYQVGDFFETFDDDAHVAARELQIVLTSRGYGPEERVPLAGFPVHAVQTYAARLVERGHKVAICEQISPPGKGLVQREVTRILTPGTVADPAMAPARRDNYLAAVCTATQKSRSRDRDLVGLAYVEVSSGLFACAEWHDAEQPGRLAVELERLSPAEILVADGSVQYWRGTDRHDAWGSSLERWPAGVVAPTTVPRGYFDAEDAHARLCRLLGVYSLDAFGCEGMVTATSAAGAVVAYLQQMNPALLRAISELRTSDASDNVAIDGRTWRALEVVEPAQVKQLSGGESTNGRTLLATIDCTRTNAGARALRRQLLRPTRDRAELEARLDAVEELLGSAALRQRLSDLLRGIGDGERLVARIAQGTATPRELLAISALLARVPAMTVALSGVHAARLREIADHLDRCDEAKALIDSAIEDESPGSTRRLRDGFSEELDAVVAAGSEARAWIAALEPRERERTGIKSLKVGYNQIFGYYIEVSHANTARVPADYERRQTLTGGERYVTPELKVFESRVLQTEERIAALERELYARLLEELARYRERMRATAASLARLDVLLSLAEVAGRGRYVRPELTEGTDLVIRAGRHPMLDGAFDGRDFVPNDITFDDCAPEDSSASGSRIVLLTGPNMAGKSTYLRQVALITLLAHIGSFVPAEFARIGMVDRIFTRVGAEDDLSAGLSTFMLEMLETAFILRHATVHSLVALDEVGRGTGTREGLAIARAVIEYLHDEVRARTLFATHFHELAGLAETLPWLRLFHLEVAEREGRIVFLHRVVPGATDESYGVHVARMAGIPLDVTRRADDLLQQSSAGATRIADMSAAYDIAASREIAQHHVVPEHDASVSSLSLVAEQILVALASVNIAATTPLEGLNLLFSLQQRAVALLQRGD